MSVVDLFYVLPIVMLCFAWRLVGLLRSPHRGCDAWYFLLSREALLKRKRLPIVLPPYFVMERQEQWYPPGFSLLLALIPGRVLQRVYWCISPAVDALIGGAIALAAAAASGRTEVGLLVGVLYAFSRSAIAETQSLTSRQLGALLMGIAGICGIWSLHDPRSVWLIASVIAGALLLLTHKFSTQALFLSFLLLAVWHGDLRYAGILLLTLTAAVILSGGFYVKVLRSHWDYIRLWTKKRNWLGAHQVHDSPIYGRPSDRFRTYKSGLRSKVVAVGRYGVQNLFALIPVAVLIALGSGRPVSPTAVTLAQWSLSILFIGLLSYVFPWLRGIGYMTQYGKLALPGALICGAMMLGDLLVGPVVLGLLAWSLLDGLRSLPGMLRSSNTQGWDIASLQPLFAHLRKIDRPLVMCIPNTYCDLVAYHCRIPVLWGGHGFPTRPLEMILPVLSRPLEEMFREYPLTHLLLDTNYAQPQQLGLPTGPAFQHGSLQLFHLKAAEKQQEVAA